MPLIALDLTPAAEAPTSKNTSIPQAAPTVHLYVIHLSILGTNGSLYLVPNAYEYFETTYLSTISASSLNMESYRRQGRTGNQLR